jgi:hypothetical protein
MSTTTAQLRIWLGVHRGVLDDIFRDVEDSPGDAAMARAMLFRRRAGLATIVGEFFAALGPTFGPYLDGREPNVPLDPAHEIEEAKAAANVVAASREGTPPPLLFERAIISEMEGRTADAHADLQELLQQYPGFLHAAVKAADLAVNVGEPELAIRNLAPIELEVQHTRDGAGVLADALRAIGRSINASRYDLIALTSPAYHDSRGNDCPPVDVYRNPVADRRMQLPFSLTWIDGRLLANDRGIYYLVAPELSALSLAELLAHHPPSYGSAQGETASSKSPSSDMGSGRRLTARLHIFVSGSLLKVLWRRRTTVQARSLLEMLSRLKREKRQPEGSFEILSSSKRAEVLRGRLEEGLTRMFGQSRLEARGQQRTVVPPFDRTHRGWVGFVANPPLVWKEAKVFIFFNGDLIGPAALTPVNRVFIGRGELSKEEIERASIHLMVGEDWEIKPPFTHIDGLMWRAVVEDLAELGDRMGDGERSSVMLFENGRALPHPHSYHRDIAQYGAGRFSHWESEFYFSTHDGSDPNTNRRDYRVLLTSRLDAVEKNLPNSRSVARGFFRRVTAPLSWSKQGWVGFVPNPPSVWSGAMVYLLIDGELEKQVALSSGNQVCVGLSERTQQHAEQAIMHIIAAQERQLTRPFTHVEGSMWMTSLQDLAGLGDKLDDLRRSGVLVFEGKRPLPHPHSIHKEIAQHGKGRFSHWGESLYFSTLDGSDPNTNGRVYSILIPQPHGAAAR